MVCGYSINMAVVISITFTPVGWCHDKSSPEEARLPLSKQLCREQPRAGTTDSQHVAERLPGLEPSCPWPCTQNNVLTQASGAISYVIHVHE